MSNINQIQNCNTELLTQQKENLINDIINGEHKNHFKVIDLECGTGKTITTEEALAKMILETDKSALFVRSTIEFCRESADRINKLSNSKHAFAFNNKDLSKKKRTEMLPQLVNYKVVCITHQKYLMLSANDKKAFTKERDILIIDEFPTDVIPMKIDMNFITFYKAFFKFEPVLFSKFNKIVSSIEDYLLAHQGDRKKSLKNFDKASVKKDIKELNRIIKSSLEPDYIKQYFNNNEVPTIHIGEDVKKTTKWLRKQMQLIQQFYERICVFSNNAIHTDDSKYNRWFLQNNILLDASGSLQSAYDLDPATYKLANLEPVLDHREWTIYNVVANTTTSGKDKITNFHEVVNNILSHNEDCLLVCKKDEVQSYNCNHKGYFWNLTGSNEFRDLKNVVIAHTPNLDDVAYILKYLHYKRKEITAESLSVDCKGKGRGITKQWKFYDPELEIVREKSIANEIYQAIKRVNRQMVHSTNCFLICNNQNIVSLVADKLKNCQVNRIDGDNFKFEFKRTDQDNYIDKLQENSYASRFITLLAEIKEGKHQDMLHKNKKGEVIPFTYSKITLREYLGIDTSAKFSNRVLNKTEVVSFCEDRNINLEGKYVKFKTA